MLQDDNAMFDDIKLMLKLKNTNQDDLVKLIIRNTQQRLLHKLHMKTSDVVPEELNYIVLEVSVKRYNRIANEGMSNYSQDGESITFNDDDFAEFEKDIDDYLNDDTDSDVPVADFYDPYEDMED